MCYMVGMEGIEPSTSFLSGTRSTTELHALTIVVLVRGQAAFFPSEIYIKVNIRIRPLKAKLFAFNPPNYAPKSSITNHSSPLKLGLSGRS